MRSTLPDWLRERLETAPRSPGCYLMRAKTAAPATTGRKSTSKGATAALSEVASSGDEGEVVYVGKAKDLKARLAQYFAPNPGDTRFFVGLLDGVLGSIDLIVTPTTKEALIMENDLIKELQPRFNVKLKDDKNFLNIRIDKRHPYPRLEVVRRQKKDGADYFGPYESATSIRNTLRVANRHFRMRTCRDTEFRNRSRPCLEHQIGRCPAPCVLPVPEAEYSDNVQDVRLFLQGRSGALLKRLKDRMKGAAQDLEFELAAHYRDQIAAIDRSLVPQAVRLAGSEDVDVFAVAREAARVMVEVLKLRSGVVTSAKGYPMTTELDDDEILEDFLAAYYNGSRPLPDLVLTPLALPDAETWSELFTDARGKTVEVRYPKRGDKRRLLEMAQDNAHEALRTRKKDQQDALATLAALQEALGLRNFPKRIECYDISNIQGTNPVASMVVAVDGQLANREYRHYKIKTLQTPNDFLMMKEVLTRRLKRGVADDSLPDLIVVDGGKGQLKMATDVLASLQVVDVDVASLAKGRVLDAAGHVKRNSHSAPSSSDVVRSEERVFRPGMTAPVALNAHSNGLFLLQRLRDEAHRFAITFHKKQRSKRTLTSELDDIAGIGPRRRQALLTHFGSVQAIRGATLEAIAACPTINQKLAEQIMAALAPPS